MTTRILVNEGVIDSLPDHLFERDTHNRDAVSSNAGRGTVVMFRHDDRDMVLKSYHRGGLPGRFIKDSYLFTGLEKTRMWREFYLLLEMRKLGLPVPEPMGARCEMLTPISYRGDLIMGRIDGASTLSETIAREPLPNATWSQIGEVIARFHNNQVFHRDLNASNILLTANAKIYLIDFDKCYFKPGKGATGWMHANLKRLQQSLLKLSSRHSNFHFNKENWQALQRGYHGTALQAVSLRG